MAPREGVVEGHRTAAVLVVLRLARARLAAELLARVDGVRPDDVEARQQVLFFEKSTDLMKQRT